MDKQVLSEINNHFFPSGWGDMLWRTFVIALSSVCSYVFDLAVPHKAIFYAILLVCFWDWILGTAVSVRDRKWESRRAIKVFIYIGVYSGLLLLLAQIQQAFVTMGWIVEGVMMPIIIFQLLSVLRNMQRLGIISNQVLTTILKKIDRYKDDEPDA